MHISSQTRLIRCSNDILVAADKAGVAQKRFYRALIAKADKRFTAHLEGLKEA